MKTVKVITTTSRKLGEQLTTFFKTIGSLEARDISLDFTGYEWSPPALAVLFTSFLVDNNVKALNISKSSYLKTTCFGSGLLTDGTDASILDTYASKYYFPVLAFSTGKSANEVENRNRIISKVCDTIKITCGLNANYYSAINYLVSEFTDNIVDHSEISRGWISFQNYPSLGYIDICICDSGSGILNSYLRYKGEKDFSAIISHAQALNNAILGESTKQMTERGYGMRTSLKCIVQGLRGDIVICSGNALLNNTDIIDLTPANYYHQGTFVIIRIPNSVQDSAFNLYRYTE